MGQVRHSPPALFIAALFSRHLPALDWASDRLEKIFGPIQFTSLLFDFNQTRYYEAEMGARLIKVFVVFDRLVALESLAALKLVTNELEAELAGTGTYTEPRPLNLDPGMLTLGKFMLATTKDQSHRIYLRDGIFAEVTLRFQAGEFHPCPWTYADYRQPLVQSFFKEARNIYHQKLKSFHL
jgi:hypothetical protein